MSDIPQGPTISTSGSGHKGALGTQQSPAPAMFREQGVNSPAYATPIDDAPNLYPRIVALRTYERMIRNDAQVRSTIRACKIPVLGGEWYVDPASSSPQDIEIADFVNYNLHNMSVTWTETLEQILRMMEFGNTVMEKVFSIEKWSPQGDGKHSKDMVMLKKLGYRPPTTIAQYCYDENGGPDGVIHVAAVPTTQPSAMIGSSNTAFSTNAPVWSSSGSPAGVGANQTQKQVYLPIEKLLIFTYDKLGGNLEGQSILRTAYKHWYYKENFYKIDGVQKERHGIGIPRIALVPGYTAADLTAAQNLGRNLRTNEEAYIIQPPGWVIDFAELHGNPADALSSAEHHDMMIARNVLVQFINSSGGSSGSSSSGGGAGSKGGASGIMYDLFLKSLRHIANSIADRFNTNLIPQLVDYNYDVKRYPTVRVRRIGENRDLQMFATSIRSLVQSNVLSIDENTELWIRSELDMPTIVDFKKARVNQLLLSNWTLPNDPDNEEADKAAGVLQDQQQQTFDKQIKAPLPSAAPAGAGAPQNANGNQHVPGK